MANVQDVEKTVLVVDDTPASLQTIEAMLFREGYRLLFADSGWECLAAVERETPDLILLDVMMPGMSGYEVCRKLKDRRELQSVPIILLTALNKKEDVLQGLESGADEFVSKPVSGPELRARVRNLLKMKSLHDELQETLKFRQEITRFLVHDMRNPLISIRMAAELGVMDSSKPEMEGTFQAILAEAQTLNRYVDEMLLAARLEGSRLKLRRVQVDLAQLYRDWSAGQSRRRGWSRVHLRECSSEVTTLGDPNLLLRLMDNLLTNALKYGGEGEIEVYLKGGSQELVFQVCDSGPGIPTELQQHIFEEHGIVPLRRSGVEQTGLGLYFCRLVAEAHGGHIKVEPNLPKGSVFTVLLPRTSGS